MLVDSHTSLKEPRGAGRVAAKDKFEHFTSKLHMNWFSKEILVVRQF